MLRIIRSLGRLSVRGYLTVGGLVMIAILATFANLHPLSPLATKQLTPTSNQQGHAANLGLNDAQNSTPPATDSPQTLSANNSTSGTPATQSSAVAGARHEAGTLVFTPLNVTLSLTRSLPLVTVSSSDGTKLSTPQVISGDLQLQSQKTSSDASPSWQMQLSGHPLPGSYRLVLNATGKAADGSVVNYTGILTVIVVL
jgi:hypothetical protein